MHAIDEGKLQCWTRYARMEDLASPFLLTIPSAVSKPGNRASPASQTRSTRPSLSTHANWMLSLGQRQTSAATEKMSEGSRSAVCIPLEASTSRSATDPENKASLPCPSCPFQISGSVPAVRDPSPRAHTAVHLQVIKTLSKVVDLSSTPYVHSYLSFRESDLFVSLLEEARKDPDTPTPQVLFVDGNGRWHPRQAGSAVAVGVKSGLPTIGIGQPNARGLC